MQLASSHADFVVSGSTIYVVNEGNRSTAAANISGFQASATSLAPISGSTQSLSATDPRPGQIAFSVSSY